MDKLSRAIYTIGFMFVMLIIIVAPVMAQGGDTCTVDPNNPAHLGQFISIAPALSDLGANEYLRINDTLDAYQPTGFFGGLYPNGSNVRPAAHTSAGISLANQIIPLNNSGVPDANGRIVLISVGMSNVAMEFGTFVNLAATDPDINPALTIVNGAQPGQVSNIWADPNSVVWQNLDNQLSNAGVTPTQVQVAWVKNTRVGVGNFPQFAQTIQGDLEAIARNLTAKYPNLKIAYFSSRTRSYTYWIGLSQEPAAYESGFAVKWMIEKQLNGNAELNFRPENGNVVAPYLSWGPYLWADGTNTRSDGFEWLTTDLLQDCTHPADAGREKVANLLLQFFKSDVTATPWFLADPASAPEIPPLSVSISGPMMGIAAHDYIFMANTMPVTATSPLTYFWQTSDGQSGTHITGVNDQINLSWETRGLKIITTTVENQFGEKFDTYGVFIGWPIYLPLILK